jgi:hypothetical protein
MYHVRITIYHLNVNTYILLPNLKKQIKYANKQRSYIILVLKERLINRRNNIKKEYIRKKDNKEDKFIERGSATFVLTQR